MPAKRTALLYRGCGKQRGAALMIMLIIMIVGVAAIFVSSLNSSALNIERDKITADALAQAKDALIGYAVSDPKRPGELPCPDVTGDGMVKMNEDFSGSDCISPIGRLPWIRLGLPELRDGAGEHLWYAVSKDFWANGSASINSETVGNLMVSGSTPANNVIAIVFSPGSALSGQSRSPTQSAFCTTTSATLAENLCATNYLEGSNANPNQPVPNTNYQTAAASDTFNDQAIFITHEQLFPGVEMRIAREAKSCLDEYALTPPTPSSAPSGKYPWAAPVTATTYYTSTTDKYFGRLPITPFNIDPSVAAVINAVAALQLALNTYSANTNASTATALSEAGLALVNAAENAQKIDPPPLSNSIINHLNQTGDQAIKLANNTGGLTVADIQLEIDTANSNLNAAAGTVDPSMSPVWPPGCIITTATYWNFWKNLVFYQVANGYQPGIISPGCGGNCLSINSSGNYRAAVVVARRAILQDRSNPADDPPTPYLEGINAHTGSTPATSFETYNPSDPNYATVNDLVLCLDGKNNCK